MSKDSVDGYSLICPDCYARWGKKESGPRILNLKVCPDCLKRRKELEEIKDIEFKKQQEHARIKRREHFDQLKESRL